LWRGNFDEFAEYRVNDIVRVFPNIPYVDVTDGQLLEIGSTSDNGFDYAPLSLGLFVCVQYVPPSFANEQYFYDSIVPVYDTVIPYEYQTGIRWDTYNYYYPMYPEIPSSFTGSVDSGYGFTIATNQTFWQALSPMVAVNACATNATKVYYIAAIESGSAFKPIYLPYSP
jgi:hypothetical protein